MWSFAFSGIAFLIYAYLKFTKTRILYPSVIFSIMWGVGCIFTFMILDGMFGTLYLSKYYSYHYLDNYISYFTAASIGAFCCAHMFFPQNEIVLRFNRGVIDNILQKYHWIMWLNFWGGILRIVLMVATVGYASVMDYRLAANDMMNSGLGPIGLVFRITNYVQMLANFYVALAGLLAGYQGLKLKNIIFLFILYSPTQMATGGRLFILYFIIFYMGSFLFGRGLSYQSVEGPFLKRSEKKTLLLVFSCLFSLVAIIAMSRQSEYMASGKGFEESTFAKFTYIAEGMLESEHYMRFSPPDQINIDYGHQLFTGHSSDYQKYRGFLQMTYMSSIVLCIITPLYTGFGYWGSIIVWFIIAFMLEALSVKCLRNLSIIRFFIFLTILKIMYETVLTNSLHGNIPVYELIILLSIFYQRIFGRLENIEMEEYEN